MKKVIFSVVLVILIGLVASLRVTAKNVPKGASKDVSLGQIQDVFIDYIDEKEISIQIGTDEYYEYIIDQLLDHNDKELMNHPKYKLIHAYMVEYKVAYDDYLLIKEGTISDNYQKESITEILNSNSCLKWDKETGEIAFSVSDEFLSQTINEIAERNEKYAIENS